MHPTHLSTQPSGLQVKKSPEVAKVVVFAIADYLLALPLSTILKVVNCPPQLNQGSERVQLLHLGHHTITVLDLHQHFVSGQPQTSPDQKKFLVVTQSSAREVCAILVSHPPDLMEIPTSVIRSLPASYSQGHPLNIASRIAVVPQGEIMLSIFMLEVDRTLELLQGKGQNEAPMAIEMIDHR